MTDSTVWWLLAGAAVALELAVGTFHLMMLSLGLGSGAIAAHLGFGVPWQLVIAAIVGGGSVTVLHFYRRSRPPRAPAASNPDVNPDIGESILVETWAADGTASARYRGASWSVVAAPGTECVPGKYRVSKVVGNRLIVEKT